MAQKTTVTMIDDLDESVSDDVLTVTFAHEGRNYEVDLGPANRQALADALAPFKAAGRRAGRSAGSPSSNRTRVQSDAAAIREWAAANGVQVNERGRIPAEVREQFEAAQK